jgi:sugar phosphate isomerase/epimerase
MKLAVMSYSFHQLAAEGEIDLFGYLETCRYRLGLRTADIWNGMLASTEEDYLRKVKEALEERDLALVNLAVDGAHLWEDDPDMREGLHQNALAHLRAAELLGAETVRIDAGGGHHDLEWTEEQFDHIVQGYQELAQRASDNGYRVGPENHWGPEANPTSLRELCQAVDNPAFGVLLHLNRWRGPEAESGDDVIAPWTMHTHLTGGIPAAELYDKMTALRDTGYDGYWSIEYPSTRYSEIELWLAQVRDVLERWRLEGRQQ